MELLLSHVGWLSASTQSVEIFAEPIAINRASTAVFSCQLTVVNGHVFLVDKSMKTETLLFVTVIKFHLDRKLRVEEEVLPST